MRRDRAECLWVTAIAAAAYGLTLAPGVQAGDSGELILAAHSLGITHPPGYPPWVLLGHAFTMLPWGSAALRVNALSAVLSALAAGLFTLLAARTGLSLAARAIATALLAGSTIVWRSAVQAEVYALTLVCFLALALLAMRARNAPHASPGAEAPFFVAAGLAPLVHQTLLFPAAVLSLWVLARRRTPASLIPALAWASLGFSLVAFLPIRAAFHPAFMWRQGLDLSGWIDYLLRRDYGALRQNPLAWHRAAGEAGAMAALVISALGALGTALAAAGALLGRGTPRAVGVVGMAALSIPMALMLLVSFTPDPEHVAQVEPFLAPVLVALALLAGAGVQALLARAPRRAHAPALAALAAAAAVTVGLHFRACDRRGFTLPERYGRELVSALPAGATLILDGDNETFLAAYATRAQGLRPDVVLIHRRGYVFGDAYGLGGVPRACWTEEAHRVDLARLATAAGPIYYTRPPEDLARAGVRFVSEGLAYRAVAPGAREPTRQPRWLEAAWPRSSELLPGGPERYDYVTRKLAVTYSDVRAQALWNEGKFAEALPWFQDAARVGFDFPSAHTNLAMAAAAAGEPELAVAELLRARALSPDDPEPAARLAALLATGRLYRDAATWFERAYRIRPAQAWAADAARAWSLAGDEERARLWRRRAGSLPSETRSPETRPYGGVDASG